MIDSISFKPIEIAYDALMYPSATTCVILFDRQILVLCTVYRCHLANLNQNTDIHKHDHDMKLSIVQPKMHFKQCH